MYSISGGSKWPRYNFNERRKVGSSEIGEKGDGEDGVAIYIRQSGEAFLVR